MLSADEGRAALWLSRRALEQALGPDPQRDPAGPFRTVSLPPIFDERRGVFVTLKRFPDDELRGCIGYPMPVLPLRTGLARAAVAAATEDPRFLPVRSSELALLAIEVSVLTPPTTIGTHDPQAIVRALSVGRHGLIVDGLGTSGLLLPQVATEQGWSEEEFLDGACDKAGLPRGAWRDPRITLRRFEAEVVRERSPGEPVRSEIAVGPAALATDAARASPRT